MSGTTARERVRERPKSITAVLTVVGYALVLGALYGLAPEGFTIGESTVNLLSHAIAAINTVATLCLIAGWWYIRNGDVRNHRRSMLSAFVLILLFLVLYLTKTGLGGTKEIALSAGPIYYAYLAMLSIHVVLSIVSVPVVLFALLLGLTHTPRELRESTPHRRVGQVAASAWILSLALGVVTYLLLNHVYGYEFVPA